MKCSQFISAVVKIGSEPLHYIQNILLWRHKVKLYYIAAIKVDHVLYMWAWIIDVLQNTIMM